MANPLQFAYRTQKTIGVFDAAPAYRAVPGFAKPEGNTRCCGYSPCGRFFAYATNEAVVVVDTPSGHVWTTLPVPNVYELGFSPRGTYLSTWERPSKDENGDANKNLKVWRTVEDLAPGAQKQPVGQWVQKSQSGWNLQYSDDEKYCARMVTNEIQFYRSEDLSTVWSKLRVEGVTDFALAPGKNQNVAVFVPERKGQPAAVKVYNVPLFNSPVSQKTFFKGDKVQLKWNGLGTALIVLAQTDVDKSNKSYYGETTMYLLTANGAFDARITLDKEGPIHDVAWSPNSTEFGVVYGYMPSKTTIFNHRGIANHTFPIAPRNTIIFSPTGRFALIAGFGNLAGQIDVYDLDKGYRKICTIESGNPSVCAWSPDSKYIMTATTSPRLRVDNGVKLWHVSGALMYNEDMVELYNVMWRPAPPSSFPANEDPLTPVPSAHPSAAEYLSKAKAPAKAVGVYRPPGARGTSTPLHFKREDEGGAAHTVSNGTSNIGANGFGRPRNQVPGAEPAQRTVPGAIAADGENLSKTALKNKKKRNRKKEGGAGGDANASDGHLAPPSDGSAGNAQNRRDRSRTRNNNGDGQQQQKGNNADNNRKPSTEPSAPAAAASTPAETASPAQTQAPTNPNAKKIRSLQKKIRAIEDLEMRLAGGEKLEDTQIKKIQTKAAVLKELEALEREAVAA
ncbi:putative eukaryotic translation initiation factor [Thermochaetoides thermophila DSM 1495]|uniref:Eukaryotic translation initiation factor 2A n=1 Tax=Chaetomium thermophilum (strain DSM 1495 / CBS 144.50 / IMI 039719) TaxID=759272 RepID=G0S2J1_CHATD|nr:putative eukaryotic translation initiation factor [Thermochaetoides thermophila DSM 1495]EGS22224.1 putative eukaryotic translation initiation factor [Thermochaetoides thermophila DSM 1495]